MIRRDLRNGLMTCCAAGFLIASVARNLGACSCEMPPAPREALRNADAVFSGRVIAVTDDDGKYHVKLSVAEVWKGVDHDAVWISTGPGNCAIWFELDRDYLIYAWRDGDDLVTNMCTRTARLRDATGDVTVLGPPLGIALKPAVSASDRVLIAVLLAGLLIAILAAWRVGWRQ